MKVSTASPCARRVDSNSDDAAIAAGALTIEHLVSFADFDRYQPRQVRKRRAAWVRLLPCRFRALFTTSVGGDRTHPLWSTPNWFGCYKLPRAAPYWPSAALKNTNFGKPQCCIER